MADNEEGREDPAHGNEWEVVSLTASAYAACPGPVEVKLNDDKQGHRVSKDKETKSTPEEDAMSRNFVFPDNQHENFPFVSGLNAVPSELAEQVVVNASDFVLRHFWVPIVQLVRVTLGMLPMLWPSVLYLTLEAICLFIHRGQGRRIVPIIRSQEPVSLERAASLTILFGSWRVESQIGKSDRSIAMYGLRMSSPARNLIMQVIAGFLKIFKYRRTRFYCFSPCNILYARQKLMYPLTVLICAM